MTQTGRTGTAGYTLAAKHWSHCKTSIHSCGSLCCHTPSPCVQLPGKGQTQLKAQEGFLQEPPQAALMVHGTLHLPSFTVMVAALHTKSRHALTCAIEDTPERAVADVFFARCAPQSQTARMSHGNFSLVLSASSLSLMSSHT